VFKRLKTETGTVLFVGMQLGSHSEENCELRVFENGVVIPWFVFVHHYRDHSQINPDDLL
jgi:hypothetical protein